MVDLFIAFDLAPRPDVARLAHTQRMLSNWPVANFSASYSAGWLEIPIWYHLTSEVFLQRQHVQLCVWFPTLESAESLGVDKDRQKKRRGAEFMNCSSLVCMFFSFSFFFCAWVCICTQSGVTFMRMYVRVHVGTLVSDFAHYLLSWSTLIYCDWFLNFCIFCVFLQGCSLLKCIEAAYCNSGPMKWYDGCTSVWTMLPVAWNMLSSRREDANEDLVHLFWGGFSQRISRCFHCLSAAIIPHRILVLLIVALFELRSFFFLFLYYLLLYMKWVDREKATHKMNSSCGAGIKRYRIFFFSSFSFFLFEEGNGFFFQSLYMQYL